MTLLKVDTSLLVLSVGAIAGGKVFSCLEINTNYLILLPRSYRNLINFVTIIGVLLGLSSTGQIHSFFLSTLFWLTPLFVFSSKLIKPVLNKIGHLDYG